MAIHNYSILFYSGCPKKNWDLCSGVIFGLIRLPLPARDLGKIRISCYVRIYTREQYFSRLCACAASRPSL